MKRVFVLAVLAAVLAFGVEPGGTGPTTQPIPLPTPADFQQMYDAGEFRICLQQIARVLMLSGDAARPYDDNALLLLRGDCLLRLEDRATALEAYSAAEKSPDPAQRAEARANALLIQNSVGLLFTPKPLADGAPISIVDRADRKKAMLALNRQLLADAKAAIDAALEAHDLVPIINGTATFIDLHSLEVAGGGTDAQIHPTLQKIGERARELMKNELSEVDGRVKRIDSKANESVDIGAYRGRWWWGGATRRGLTTDDRESLRRDADYADRITAAARHFQEVSQTLGGTGEKWYPVIDTSTRIAQHARDVLAAE